MKKLFEKPIEIEFLSIDGRKAVRIVISLAISADWCSSLLLLKEGLVDSIVVKESALCGRVEFNCINRDSSTFSEHNQRLVVSFANRDLEFVIHFFLIYYRDGYSKVNHVDLETDQGDYITLKTGE